MVNKFSFDWKSPSLIITICFFISALAAAAVKYNTANLTTRVTVAEEEIIHINKEVGKKADSVLVIECLENMKKAIVRIEEGQKVLQQDIKDLTKEIIKK